MGIVLILGCFGGSLAHVIQDHLKASLHQCPPPTRFFLFCWEFLTAFLGFAGAFLFVSRNEEIKLLWVSWTCLPLMRGAYWKHTFLDRPNSPGLPLLGAEQALLENRCNSQAVWGVSLHSSVLCSWALSKMEQGQGPQSIPSFRVWPSCHAQGSTLRMLHLLFSLTRSWGSQILGSSTPPREKTSRTQYRPTSNF